MAVCRGNPRPSPIGNLLRPTGRVRLSMIPNAKIEALENAPPENIFNKAKRPSLVCFVYLLPLLIAYTAGRNVAGERGGVIGAIATAGVIVGSERAFF